MSTRGCPRKDGPPCIYNATHRDYMRIDRINVGLNYLLEHFLYQVPHRKPPRQHRERQPPREGAHPHRRQLPGQHGLLRVCADVAHPRRLLQDGRPGRARHQARGQRRPLLRHHGERVLHQHVSGRGISIAVTIAWSWQNCHITTG